jgi:hypothetical protein
MRIAFFTRTAQNAVRTTNRAGSTPDKDIRGRQARRRRKGESGVADRQIRTIQGPDMREIRRRIKSQTKVDETFIV